MKLDQLLHLRFRNVDGPLAAYCDAEPWTREVQQFMEEEYERAKEPIGLIAPRFTSFMYRCPTCRRAQREIRFESLVFYGDDDFIRLQPLGEAQLITMVDCGHQYRREIGGARLLLRRVVQTCWACPSQWDAWTVDGQYLYLRYRWGVGTVEDEEHNELARFNTRDELGGCIDLEEFLTRSGLTLADEAEVS